MGNQGTRGGNNVKTTIEQIKGASVTFFLCLRIPPFRGKNKSNVLARYGTDLVKTIAPGHVLSLLKSMAPLTANEESSQPTRTLPHLLHLVNCQAVLR